MKRFFFPLKNHFYLDRHKNATKIPNSKLMFKYFSSECHYMRVFFFFHLSLTLFAVDDGKSPEMIGFGARKNKFDKFDNRSFKKWFLHAPAPQLWKCYDKKRSEKSSREMTCWFFLFFAHNLNNIYSLWAIQTNFFSFDFHLHKKKSIIQKRHSV